jgi:hypothetical protein
LGQLSSQAVSKESHEEAPMRRPLSTALALAAGAVFLQACSAPQPTREDGTAHLPHERAAPAIASPNTQGLPRPSAPLPAGLANDGGFTPAAATLVSAPRASVAASAPLRSPRAARDLAGLTDGQLLSVMGEPDLRRDEDQAQAWLYRSAACLLDVFLEAEEPGREPRVVLATARAVGEAPLAEEACLRGLSRTRAGLRPPFQP